MADERGLHWMKRAFRCQPFDGGDLVSVVHHREGEATVDSLPIDEDRTRATLPLVAALLRAGQPEMFTKRVEQRRARVELDDMAPAIDREPHSLDLRRRVYRRLGRHRVASEHHHCAPG